MGKKTELYKDIERLTGQLLNIHNRLKIAKSKEEQNKLQQEEQKIIYKMMGDENQRERQEAVVEYFTNMIEKMVSAFFEERRKAKSENESIRASTQKLRDDVLTGKTERTALDAQSLIAIMSKSKNEGEAITRICTSMIKALKRERKEN